GIAVPEGGIATSADEAVTRAQAIGRCVIKAQVPTGKRGKAGGIALAGTPEEARKEAERILGMEIGGHTVAKLLVEQQVPIATELYAAVLNDAASKGPLLLFSGQGGMDIEEIAEQHPDQLLRMEIDIRRGLDRAALESELPDVEGAARGDI